MEAQIEVINCHAIAELQAAGTTCTLESRRSTDVTSDRNSEHLISLVDWHDVMYISLSLSLSQIASISFIGGLRKSIIILNPAGVAFCLAGQDS